MSDEFEHKIVYKKKYSCPICYKEFTSLKYMTTKLTTVKKEMDLRIVYKDFDIRKYEPIVCTHCGYTAFDQNYKSISPKHRQSIIDNVSKIFTPYEDNSEIYTYQDALKRYSLLIICAKAIGANYSTSANIFLKNAWLIKGIIENDKCEECGMTELEAKNYEKNLKAKALKGFNMAIEHESFPMCGMNEETVTYLIAVLAYEADDIKLASEMVSKLLCNRTVSQRVKDKIYDLKELIRAKKYE